MRRENGRVLWTAVAVVLLVSMALLAGCSDSDEEFNKPGEMTGTCVSCHQDQDLLMATAEPEEDTGGEDAGEG